MTVYPQKSSAAHITLRLDEALVEALRRIAEVNDRSVSAEARIAIREHLKRDEEKAS